MKELSIEEKAKAYDEALKVAKGLYAKDAPDSLHLERMFPELAESEDERIRKAIIEIVKKDEERIGVNAHLKKIQWLEKQGEHVKFLNSIQVGDKVTRNEDGVLVNLSQLKRVAKPAENKGEHDMGISEATKQKLEDNFNKALEKETPKSCNEFLEKQDEKKEEEIEKWLGCEAFPEGTNITPLPKAMEIVRKTANHFYDFGRKQQAIRNIQCTNSQVITPESYINEGQKKGIQIVLDNPQEYGLHKIAKWSEEDERMYRGLHNLIYSTPYCDSRKNLSDWLKSLKDRVQLKVEWNEEDEKCIRLSTDIIDCALRAGFCVQLDRDRCVDWLKSLRPQNWTKEDKERYISCLQRLSTGNPEQPETINSKWFKEHVYPQATWKPSDEQIKALSYYIENYVDNDGVFGRQLVKLYHDLLILRKE